MFAGISVSVSILFAWKGGFWNKNSRQEIHFLQNDPNRCVRDAQCIFACLTVECYKFSGLTSPGNFICMCILHKYYSLWITFLFVTSMTWSGGTEVTGRWSLTNLQQHALIRRFLLHDHAHPWLLFVLLAASLETWCSRSTLTPEFKTMEALAGWTPNWLPSSIRPLWPDVTVGPVAKFAISRLLLGMTTVIWFCIGLSYNNPTGMAAGTSGSFKKETRWDCRVFAAYLLQLQAFFYG